jgi:HEPN domain-containing protein
MLHKQTDDKNPGDWFAFAEERLRAADVLWKHVGLTASGIEILQEAVERYLKGYLIAKGWTLVKTHDLERLLKEAAEFDPAFARFKALAEELTEDFFAQHYPGEDTTLVGQNYDTLRQQTGQLVTLIEQSLPHYFRTNPKS